MPANWKTFLSILTAFGIAACAQGLDVGPTVEDQKREASEKQGDREALARALENQIDFDEADADSIRERFAQITTKKRPVFTKSHGCVRAEFSIPKHDPGHAVGLFAEPTELPKPAWLRISSDTRPTTPDQANSTVGFALKVLDVPGEKILEGEKNFPTHDFLLQNHHVFFVDTAKDFMEFTEAIFAGKLTEYKASHPVTAQTLDDMTKVVENVRAAEFHSTTPFRFGMEDHAKYRVKSCGDVASVAVPDITADPNYLATRFAADVADENVDVCFELQVQLRIDDMPLDEGTVAWNPEESEFKTVATVVVPTQDIAANSGLCEKMSFTTWHALPEHRPVGSVNEARGVVYKAIADLRREKSGVSVGFPDADGNIVVPR